MNAGQPPRLCAGDKGPEDDRRGCLSHITHSGVMDNNPSPSNGEPGGTREEALRGLAARLGVEMRAPLWFDRALTHASSVAEEGSGADGDYESLEFLGDAVLGLAVAHYLFYSMPDRTPGEHSRIRAAMVNR